MGFFKKLDEVSGLRLLCGMTVTIGRELSGEQRLFAFRTESGGRAASPGEYTLLALHYYGHILARYPKDHSVGYQRASELQWWVGRIIEEGIWPGSDLIRYSGQSDRMRLVDADVALDGPEIRAALIRPLLGDDLDAVFELPAGVGDEELMLSVIAVLQGMMRVLDDNGIQLIDRALRYLRSYHDEGADYTAPVAARNLANRAFRDAGGTAA